MTSELLVFGLLESCSEVPAQWTFSSHIFSNIEKVFEQNIFSCAGISVRWMIVSQWYCTSLGHTPSPCCSPKHAEFVFMYIRCVSSCVYLCKHNWYIHFVTLLMDKIVIVGEKKNKYLKDNLPYLNKEHSNATNWNCGWKISSLLT